MSQRITKSILKDLNALFENKSQAEWVANLFENMEAVDGYIKTIESYCYEVSPRECDDVIKVEGKGTLIDKELIPEDLRRILIAATKEYVKTLEQKISNITVSGLDVFSYDSVLGE